jgi:hypothetical protein
MLRSSLPRSSFIVFTVASVLACAAAKEQHTVNPHAPSQRQLLRKKKNIDAIKAMGLPVLEHLPVIEDETDIKPRTTQEIVKRCLAAEFCALKGEADDQKKVDQLLAQLVDAYAVASAFSPHEKQFLANPAPSRTERAKFTWRYECVHVFLWALGYLPSLMPPNRTVNVADESAIIVQRGPKGFAEQAHGRPLSEILDMADLYYRLHWAAMEMRLHGKTSDKLDGEITMERLRALNWLVRYLNQEWDDVTTDT